MKITIHKNSITVRTEEITIPYFSNFLVGAEGTLGARYNVSPNAIRTGESEIPMNVWLDDVGGIQGNSNPNIRRTRGWRGTTDDVSVYALGVIKITAIEQLKKGTGLTIRFKHLKDDDDGAIGLRSSSRNSRPTGRTV